MVRNVFDGQAKDPGLQRGAATEIVALGQRVRGGPTAHAKNDKKGPQALRK